MYFIYVRHGESEANAAQLVPNAGLPHLTLRGVEQARTTGFELLDRAVGTIVSSPYARALETAQTIAEVVGIDPASIIVIDELHERRYGVQEGKSSRMLARHQGWQFEENRLDKFEPQADVLKRQAVALHKIAALCPWNGELVVVGHSVAGFFLMEAARGVTDPSKLSRYYEMPNAGYVEVEYDAPQGACASGAE